MAWHVVARDGNRFLLEHEGKPLVARVYDLESSPPEYSRIVQETAAWWRWGEWEDATLEEFLEAGGAEELLTDLSAGEGVPTQ